MPAAALCNKKWQEWALKDSILKSLTNISIQPPTEPPFFDGIICRDKQSFPRPCEKDFLEENFRHVENGDEDE